jgi:gluconate 2-dehydrogenase gamma chain
MIQRKGYISPRDFLKISTIGLAGAVLAACQPADEMNTGIPGTPIPVPNQYPDIPFAPPLPLPNILVVLSAAEARTVEALTARIYPGDANDPGAREAGVTNFIDKKLSFHDGYVVYTYTQPPFAKTYEGDQPPAQTSNQDGGVVWVKKSEIERYGFQSPLSPLERYRNGIASVNRYANEKFGANFADLTEDQQDQILGAMEKGEADFSASSPGQTGTPQPATPGIGESPDPTAKQFFDMLQGDTVQGMFADPAYGGNKDMIGWRQIGYPGSQRAYTPTDMNTEGPIRPPQSLAMLHRFHSGMNANSEVIVPSSGSQLTPHP